jgi:hypothetical protein
MTLVEGQDCHQPGQLGDVLTQADAGLDQLLLGSILLLPELIPQLDWSYGADILHVEAIPVDVDVDLEECGDQSGLPVCLGQITAVKLGLTVDRVVDPFDVLEEPLQASFAFDHGFRGLHVLALGGKGYE